MAQITFLEGGGRFEDAPTCKGRQSPDDVIVLNDQGGNSINVETGDVSPTIRAETHGNLPIVCAGFSGEMGAKAKGIGFEEELAPTLKSQGAPCALAVHQNQCGEVRTGKVANTINTNGNASGRNAPLVCHCIQGNIIGRSEKSGADGIGVTGDVSYTLTKNDRHAVAYMSTSFAQYAEGVGTLKASGGDLGGGSETLVAIGIDEEANAPEEKMGALLAHTSGGMREYVATFVEHNFAVRRLTPMECERLQGFPDGWTEHGINPEKYRRSLDRGMRRTGLPEKTLLKKISDSARYRALGNSVAIPCVEFVMGNIAKIMEDE